MRAASSGPSGDSFHGNESIPDTIERFLCLIHPPALMRTMCRGTLFASAKLSSLKWASCAYGTASVKLDPMLVPLQTFESVIERHGTLWIVEAFDTVTMHTRLVKGFLTTIFFCRSLYERIARLIFHK